MLILKVFLKFSCAKKSLLKGEKTISFWIHKLMKNEKICYVPVTEDERSMITYYYYSVYHQSGLQRNTFSKLSSKCAANYDILFQVFP